MTTDGRYAVAGGGYLYPTLILWDVSTGREIRTLEGHSAVAFSPDGRYALSGSGDKTLKLWDISTGREIRTFKGHSSRVYSVAFSPDGRYALSGSYDNKLKLWDVSTGREIRTFEGHYHYVNHGYSNYIGITTGTFAADGIYAPSVSRGNTVNT